jgi:uncharacterized membrane protein
MKKEKNPFSSFKNWTEKHSILFYTLIGILIAIPISIIILKFENKIHYKEIYISDIKPADENFTIFIDNDFLLVSSDVGSNGEITVLKYPVKSTDIYKTLSENDKPYVEIKSNKDDGILKIKMYVPENAEILVS